MISLPRVCRLGTKSFQHHHRRWPAGTLDLEHYVVSILVHSLLTITNLATPFELYWLC